MIEIRIHGRGGFGVKKAANILARAAYIAGNQTQDFALYGAERRGAPLTSFVRFDKNPIRTRGYIFKPDFIVILDDSLDLKHCIQGAVKKTPVIINTDKTNKTNNFHQINATKISINLTKKNIPNAITLGALLKFLKQIKINHLKKAIQIELKKFPKEIINKNIQGAELAYKQVK